MADFPLVLLVVAWLIALAVTLIAGKRAHGARRPAPGHGGRAGVKRTLATALDDRGLTLYAGPHRGRQPSPRAPRPVLATAGTMWHSLRQAVMMARSSHGTTVAEPLAGRRPLLERLRKTLAHNWQLYVLVSLPLVYLIIFQYVPMYGAQLAFKKYRAALGIWGSEWVGFDHFVAFFESFQFQRIVRNTISISAYSLVAGFPVPIVLAMALNNSQARRFKKSVQLVTYAPHFISTVVMCGMIIQFLSPNVGIGSIRGALSGALPGRPGARPKQHLDSLLDERLSAGIFLRRDDAKLPRHVRRDVGADVAAALATCGRRSAPWRAALECGRVVVGGAHAAPLMVFECSRRSSVHAMNACTAATS